MAKFSNSGVWDKAPDGKCPYFLDIPEFPLNISTQIGTRERKLPCPNQLDSFVRFDRTLTCDRHRQTDRQTDRHRQTDTGLESDVDRVELFRLPLRFFGDDPTAS